VYKERLLVEPTQHRCDLVSMDAFASNASVSLAIPFIRETRLLLDPDGSLAATGQPAPLLVQPVAPAVAPQTAPSSPSPSSSPASPSSPSVQAAPSSGTVPSPMSATPSPVSPAIVAIPVPLVAGSAAAASSPSLSFKATVLDENGDGVLEGGEQVKVRVDVVNAGLGPAVGVKIRISGTPAVVSQFPAETLPVGNLQPGESRSVIFTAVLPQRIQTQRVELLVTASETSGSSAPASQTLVTSLR